MIFGYFTLLVALVISTVAAYYSIVGLTAIFSAAVIPILIMGASLEVGKVTAAVWLKINWHRASLMYKFYLVPAVAFLMLLTSMGIFGFLSKAHSDQSLVSGDSMAKVAIYDEKIKISKDNIDADRKAIKQMDEAVDQVMGRSQDEKGADKAVAIRRGQQKERARLLMDIEAEQKKVSALNEERAPLAAEFRKVESEVGPIKYIAALVYGDNPDTSVLEKAVRLVIIIIVAVFDPLALVLILAAQQSIRWAQEEKEVKYDPDDGQLSDDQINQLKEIAQEPVVEEKTTADEILQAGVTNSNPADAVPIDEQLTDEQIEQLVESTEGPGTDPHPVGWMFNEQTGAFEERPQVPTNELAYLNEPFVHFKDLKPMPSSAPYKVPEPAATTPIPLVVEETPVEVTPVETVPESKSFPRVPETVQRIKAETVPVPETMHNPKTLALQADNVESEMSNSSFGIKFPESANRGDMFLRVDYLPNKLFKFNGFKWIEVDKSNTDSYTYDEQYILFLIEKLQSGEYEIDQLSASEQELVAEKLKKLTNDNT